MRIGIMGSGSVGTYYGAKLAKAGYPVTFIARGAHLKALQTSGLTVVGQEEFHLPKVDATNDTVAVGPVDVLLMAVKAYDLEEAARLAAPMVGPQTMVVPLLNGIDIAYRLAGTFGREQVVGGLCKISVDIPQPGTVRLNSPFREIIFGELNGTPTARTARFAAALERAEIPHRVSGEMTLEIWKKFVFIVAMSGITGATRSSIGPIRECPETFALYGRIAAEAVAVGQAAGVVALDSGMPEELIKQARAAAAGLKASLLVDLEKGRRTEVETLQGALVRQGTQLGVPTPVTEVIYALIKLHQPH